MSQLVQSFTRVLSFAIVLGDALIVFLIVSMIVKKVGLVSRFVVSFINFFGTRAVVFSFLVALGSMSGSLFYSEIAGFAPCVLCWWQRIFLFPQVFILGFALWRKDWNVGPCSILLSAIGGTIALYHSYIQFGGSPFIPCSTSGVSAQCAQRYFLEFNYITIPTMALTAFIMIIVFMLAGKMANKKIAINPAAQRGDRG